MKYILLALFALSNIAFAYDFGTIASASKSGHYYKISNEIEQLLKNYDIKLEPIVTNGSYKNMSILNENNKETFFAIVQKDAIDYYNYKQSSLGNKKVRKNTSVILSLGNEQIHVLVNKNKEIDFEVEKKYKVYCGETNSGSCVTSRYIEKAYGLTFSYHQDKNINLLRNLESGVVDMAVMVHEKPIDILKNDKNIIIFDLPTNFIMEEMYIKDSITSKDYSWIQEKVHVFSVPRALVTNLVDKKYEKLVDTLVKIIVQNQGYLTQYISKDWKNIDFTYTEFKNFYPSSKAILESLN